ncbi:DNA repair protein REV1-like isoform X3 [Solanum dulcamara]|uniref:DNA repair protein REV1-like isoform X3 n=1 Tax=Solanum dulcamara TaxID=45834 RepID=UPI00248500E9|nr:DNA repair protein REV1-like isoform X3 [Solanum dulcamara]
MEPSRSANSGSNSKRTPNSNRSNSSNQSNKKKKASQKTLGMAWGANSRSASRPAFYSSPFSNFGSYMAVKNQKLHEQFEVEASITSLSGPSSSKPIFQGVSIFVDGYTVPSSQELRGYMLKHGGRFENYFSRRRVTHIICSNLPDSKVQNLRSFSRGLPVVKPTWVLDSVSAKKLLNWVPYQLDQLASEVNNQPKLSAFFTKNIAIYDDMTTCSTVQATSRVESPLSYSGPIEDPVSFEESQSAEDLEPRALESKDLMQANYNVDRIEESSCSMAMQELSDAASGDGSQAPFSAPFSPHNDASVCSDWMSDPVNTAPSNLKIPRSPNQRHSTLVDANFVENYFKHSRLHFIGTWRNRYRKRFPSSPGGFRCISSGPSSSATANKTMIIHVDMDCFFVSVVIRNRPELKDKPVAICHSDNPRGTAEISSANYPARGYGVKAGMFVRDAKSRCPHLVILSYDFEAYEEVADRFYNILHKYCNKVQAVSCDEAFLDATDSGVEEIQAFVSVIRDEILDATGCTASAGIAENMLMARLATRIAKPDGQCYIPAEKVEEHLCELPVKALPGIGHVLEEKLNRRQITTCGQLRMISKETLQRDFGSKTGSMLWNYSRGIDDRLVGMIQESKSIGADVNWGVRFKDLKDVQHFLLNLCKEVSLRLQGCGVIGRKFTLKIKKRKGDAGEPVKYLGCGVCDNLSHSVTVPMATDSVDVLERIVSQLFTTSHVDVEDIRGMGLQVSKLETADSSKQGLFFTFYISLYASYDDDSMPFMNCFSTNFIDINPGKERCSIRSWLTAASAKTNYQNRSSSHEKGADADNGKNSVHERQAQLQGDSSTPFIEMTATSPSGAAGFGQRGTLPPMNELDIGVIESLPPEVFSEINDMYDGKLAHFITEKRSKGVSEKENISSVCPAAQDEVFAAHEHNEEEIQAVSYPNKLFADMKSGTLSDASVPNMDVVINALVSGGISLMPSSLSQVDTSVFQELPEELRADILELLPAHRNNESSLDASLVCANNQNCSPSISSIDLWVGNPPEWIDIFKASNCQILCVLGEMYQSAGARKQLSSILQRTMSQIYILPDVGTDGWVEAVSFLSELIKKYLKLKISTDIEEVYTCSCLLRRNVSINTGRRASPVVYLQTWQHSPQQLVRKINWRDS